MGKGAHPLTTVLYLKRIEGMARSGRPLRPATVSVIYSAYLSAERMGVEVEVP
jgi:hypothetical protein